MPERMTRNIDGPRATGSNALKIHLVTLWNGGVIHLSGNDVSPG